MFRNGGVEGSSRANQDHVVPFLCHSPPHSPWLDIVTPTRHLPDLRKRGSAALNTGLGAGS